MTSAFNKFQDFSDQLARGNQSFGSHVFKVALTNTAPVSTQLVFDSAVNAPAPAAASGYAAGVTTISISVSAGTTTVLGTQVVFTATGGQIGPFRYAILYNDTVTSPAKPPVGWFDYGASITLNDTETLTVQFGGATPGSIFTLV